MLVAFRTNPCILGVKLHCFQGKIHLLRNIHFNCLQQSYSSVLDLEPCFNFRHENNFNMGIFHFCIYDIAVNNE